MKEKDSIFIKKYRDKMVDIMLMTNPTWDKEDVKKIVMDTILKQFENPKVELDNNFTGEHTESTLLTVFDWILTRKPIIAGNGTFYKNQHEALNPVAKMLDDMADNRKLYKKDMFKAGEIYGEDSNEYKDLDRLQRNEKQNMNSYYGSSGAKTSAFYSKWSGPATTLTAQSVISTAETFFESFLADNYIYINLTEVIEWIMVVLKEKDVVLDDFIQLHSREELLHRLLEKILQPEDNDEEILYNFLLSLSDEDITRLYYKNNLIEFIRDNEFIQNLFLNVFDSVENLKYVDLDDELWLNCIPLDYRRDYVSKTSNDWNKFVNKMFFMDPNDPPKQIKSALDILSMYIMKYVFVHYLSFDRIYRLRNFERRVVTVIDTDSNFLSLDTLINFLFDDVIAGATFGREHNNNVFIAVNTITFVITDAIDVIMKLYGEKANVPKEYRHYFNMKNEFFNSLLVIGKAKKRYITKQILREGNYMNPPKTDIKGFDFKKASCSEYAENAFMKIINDHIINSEKIELKDILIEIKKFKEEVISSIKRGENTFLPNGNAKELAGYSDPGTIQSVRGVLSWNLLEPDNIIELPAKVSLLKMNIFKREDVLPLKETHPEIYDIIITKIFGDETGIFVTKEWNPGIDYVNVNKKKWWADIPKKFRTKYKKLGPYAWNEFVDEVINGKNKKYEKDLVGKYEYKEKGLQVLAIPSNGKIPEWAQPYIDYSTMVNNIIAPFKPVLEIFGSKFVEEGRTKNSVNRKTETVSNIIKF